MSRINIVNRLSILTSRQTCIWIDHDRNGGNLQDIFQDLFHLYRTESAVHTQYIYAQTL